MIYIDKNVYTIDEYLLYKLSKRLNKEFKNTVQGILSAAAWMLLGYALKNEFQIGLEDIHIKYGEHGKPYIDNHTGIEFNLTHSHNVAAAALSTKPVGIDVQKIMKYNDRLAKRICSDKELKLLEETENKRELLYSMWAMKESYVKYTGTGMTCNFQEIPYAPLAKLYTVSKDYTMAVCSAVDLDIKYMENNEYTHI